ncbi:MAG: hypothetical protein ACJ06V_04070 [Verrucomicrobiota bacterium]
MVVFYGTDKNDLSKTATLKSTSINRDNTGILTLSELQPNTHYHYRIADHQLDGSFRTLPRSADFKNAKGNPEGLLNFQFEFACGNNQRGGGDDKQTTTKKDDAWTVFLREREELIEFWGGLDKGVFVLTGDLHNSFAIRITDIVWEFAKRPARMRHPLEQLRDGGYSAREPYIPSLLRGANQQSLQQRLQQPARARRRAVVRLPASAGDLPVPRCVHR